MTRRIPFGYSLLAPMYDIAARVGSLGAIPEAQRALLQALPVIHDLLIVGGGSGLCLRFVPWERVSGRVTFVDIAPGMLRKARRAAQALGIAERIQFLQEGVEAVGFQRRFDAIYTAFFLDQFFQPRCEAILQLLDAVLSPGGVWLDVDFTSHVQGRSARLYRAVVIPFLYGFFRLFCGIESSSLPDPWVFWRARQYVCLWESSYPRASIASRILKKSLVSHDCMDNFVKE